MEYVTETQIVHTHKVSCDGSSQGLGHPRVYLDLGTKGYVICPYCSKKFVLAEENTAS